MFLKKGRKHKRKGRGKTEGRRSEREKEAVPKMEIPRFIEDYPIWEGVPVEIFVYILSQVPLRDLCRSKAVSRSWYTLISDRDYRTSLPMNDLQLWLDATQKCDVEKDSATGIEGVKRWESLVGTNFLVPHPSACVGRGGSRRHEIGSPKYIRNAINGCPGVFFDFGHTAKFNRPIRPCTIASVHSFEREGRLDHKVLHGYPGELCNFYILTDSTNISMHTDDEASPTNLHSDCGHAFFRNGQIRIDGKKDVPVAQSRRWTDKGLKMAVLRMTGSIPPLSWIGADRDCHQYCGTIAELLVWDRQLTNEEIEAVEAYLIQKYYV